MHFPLDKLRIESEKTDLKIDKLRERISEVTSSNEHLKVF